MPDKDETGQLIATEVGTLVGRVAAAIEAGDEVEVTRTGTRITATLQGEQVAPFIGRHGHVIDAVQHLATRIAAKHAPGGDWVVTVRPELVVEIAFDGVQTSSRYPGGMALRFARVLRHRPDKSAAEADTVAAVRTVHDGAGVSA